jgi:tetratricopeptide (TPR) repeat protein
MQLLERAVAADRDSALTYAGLAEAQWYKYFSTHEMVWRERAQESVRQAELRNLDLAEVHLASGLLKADSSFLEQAEADYQRAIELQPNNGDAYRRLSGIFNRNNQPNEALAAIQKAVQLQPDYFKNHQQLGTLYILRGDYRDAVPEFQKMADLAPHLAQSHSALGAALGYLGRLPEAEKELRAAVHLEDSSDNEETLGAILMDLGKPGEAISCFLQALALGPGSTNLWLDLGLSYGRESRESDAKAAFRNGLAVAEKDLIKDPRDKGERARLAYLAARLGDSGRADFEIAQTLQVSGDDSDVSLMAVLTYEALGRREQTLALLTRLPTVLGQLNRYPELADLRSDPRFLQLLSSNNIQH